MKRIDKYRSTFFLFALATALGFINLAFNYTNYDKEITQDAILDPIDPPFVIIRTPPPRAKKVPPPPKPIIDLDKPDPTNVEFLPSDEDPDPDLPDSLETVIDSNIQKVTGLVKGFETTEPPVKVEPTLNNDDDIYNQFSIEKMPFMGDCYGIDKEEQKQCFERTLYTYLSERIHYPVMARESNIEGTVFIQFVVSKTGQLIDLEIMRGVQGGCSEEVLRVFKEMPVWSPGIQNGRPVNVRFTAPVKFKLQ